MCRGVVLSLFLDGRITMCILLPNTNLCDFCRKQKQEAHPQTPVVIPAIVTPSACVPKIGPLPPVPPPSIKYAREILEALPAARYIWFVL